MVNTLNAREQLEAAARWLSYQEENLSFGLKKPEDGLKLWRYWTTDKTLPEFCDGPESDDEAVSCRNRRIAAIGYCPFVRNRLNIAIEDRLNARQQKGG